MRSAGIHPIVPAAGGAAWSPAPGKSLVQTQRAEQRIAAQARDDFRLAGQDAGLRTAQQFIAAERNQIRAGQQAVGNQRLVDAERAQVDHAAAAQIFVHRDAALAAQRNQFRDPGAP
jgi:hypothetical protein